VCTRFLFPHACTCITVRFGVCLDWTLDHLACDASHYRFTPSYYRFTPSYMHVRRVLLHLACARMIDTGCKAFLLSSIHPQKIITHENCFGKHGLVESVSPMCCLLSYSRPTLPSLSVFRHLRATDHSLSTSGSRARVRKTENNVRHIHPHARSPTPPPPPKLLLRSPCARMRA
jgi:hypothetical protein